MINQPTHKSVVIATHKYVEQSMFNKENIKVTLSSHHYRPSEVDPSWLPLRTLLQLFDQQIFVGREELQIELKPSQMRISLASSAITAILITFLSLHADSCALKAMREWTVSTEMLKGQLK